MIVGMGSKDEEDCGNGEGEGDDDEIGSELQPKHSKIIIKKYKKRIGGRTSPATLFLT